MIAGLSKAVAVYLAPVLSLTGMLLSLFAFLAPAVILHDRVALLTVRPSLAITNPESHSDVDGPSVFMGVLGSCARSDNAASISCTTPSVSPIYDLSVLPGDAPSLLTAPTTATPAFIAVSLCFSAMFFLLFTMISFRAKLGRLSATLDKPIVQRLTAWIGLFGFMLGLSAFLIIRMWFGKAVDDFNQTISNAGSDAPDLMAATSNAFIMVWVAYSFYTVPLVCSLAKLHVTATKA
ncbi:hypothetical protein PUNSTDRAFT_48642 [Punctularia strigosozonata HHB-11173 SS5]|uniref:uncharacterized protein n=1 Tax=Punctularia strigosozonata (strain HHB-11173) TaxID=741275 RepID=UPI00044182D6|nr:uncharacterized protein PUNSTDRAFT_48642 [Punctularia strigosozonata HHB-11173 SS5]EIN13710.1 hypothetical protein PUNSTDRAFT_48642 [Punctularia strigosozonata HHB-11173 SS5]